VRGDARHLRRPRDSSDRGRHRRAARPPANDAAKCVVFEDFRRISRELCSSSSEYREFIPFTKSAPIEEVTKTAKGKKTKK